MCAETDLCAGYRFEAHLRVTVTVYESKGFAHVGSERAMWNPRARMWNQNALCGISERACEIRTRDMESECAMWNLRMRYEESVSHILKVGAWKWRVKKLLCKKVGIY